MGWDGNVYVHGQRVFQYSSFRFGQPGSALQWRRELVRIRTQTGSRISGWFCFIGIEPADAMRTLIINEKAVPQQHVFHTHPSMHKYSSPVPAAVNLELPTKPSEARIPSISGFYIHHF